MPASALEEAVWQDVCALLREPRRLAAEFQRRCDQPAPPAETLAWLQQQQAKEKRALGRLIDAYENGLLNKEELAPRLERTRQRLQQWQTQAQEFLETQARERDLDHAVGRLEDFAQRIDAGLRQPTPTQKREILKALIKRVEIAPEKIRVIYKIHPLPKLGNEEVGSLQHCPSRVCALCETTDFPKRKATSTLMPLSGTPWRGYSSKQTKSRCRAGGDCRGGTSSICQPREYRNRLGFQHGGGEVPGV
jgi:site-specific DNA recombinase